MTNPNFTFLNGSAIRNTNLLTTAEAEAGTGWTANAPATAIPAQTTATAVPSPFNTWDQATGSAWAYACRMNPGAGGTYTIANSGGTAYSALLNVVSAFIRQPVANAGGTGPSTANPATTFTLGWIPGGTGQLHGHRFSYNSTSGTWIAGTNIGNGRGIILPGRYADGWQRVAVAHQIGWVSDAGTADTTVAGDTVNVFLGCQNAKFMDVWGINWEQQAAVTANVGTNIDVIAKQIRPREYLSGLGQIDWDSNLGPLGFQPTRARYHKGIYQVKSTVTGTTFSLLRRASVDAPWEVAQATVFGDLNADFTKCYEIEVAPEYRLAITALAATGVQGAWLAT